MTQPDLTAAEIALLDQVHAEGNDQLDRLVDHLRVGIAEQGPTLACAAFTAELMTSNKDRDWLCSLAGLAATRLAQQAPGGAA